MRRSINFASRQRKRPDPAARPFLDSRFKLRGAPPQVEYLNSGIAFSSSLVALKMAWSGHQGFGFEAGAVVAAPVVVVEPPPGRMLPAPPAGALAAPV